MRNRLVQRAELFDIYSGENLAPGTRSLGFHLHFQAADRTLTNEEVTRVAGRPAPQPPARGRRHPEELEGVRHIPSPSGRGLG